MFQFFMGRYVYDDGVSGEIFEPHYVVMSQNFPSDIAKIKTNVGGSLIVYELPAALPLIAPMSAAEERGGCVLPSSHASTPLHHRHHGDQQQQQWGLGHIQRGLTSEYRGFRRVCLVSKLIHSRWKYVLSNETDV